MKPAFLGVFGHIFPMKMPMYISDIMPMYLSDNRVQTTDVLCNLNPI